jgi:hypothetical protein
MPTGYEQIYESLIPRLEKLNFTEAAARLGFTKGKDGWRVLFLNREYAVSEKGVFPADGLPAEVNYRSVLAYYALSKGAGGPGADFAPLSRLSGPIPFSGGNGGAEWMLAPLVRASGGEYARFEKAARALGGAVEGEEKGGFVWTFAALPNIRLRAAFFEADEEFPCEIKLFFDSHAARFLDFECLAFLQGCWVRSMVNALEK